MRVGDARGRTRRIWLRDGGDLQCHFVPGVAAPSVFDPQLPRLRVVSHTRSVSPRPTEINDPVRRRARKEETSVSRVQSRDGDKTNGQQRAILSVSRGHADFLIAPITRSALHRGCENWKLEESVSRDSRDDRVVGSR